MNVTQPYFWIVAVSLFAIVVQILAVVGPRGRPLLGLVGWLAPLGVALWAWRQNAALFAEVLWDEDPSSVASKMAQTLENALHISASSTLGMAALSGLAGLLWGFWARARLRTKTTAPWAWVGIMVVGLGLAVGFGIGLFRTHRLTHGFQQLAALDPPAKTEAAVQMLADLAPITFWPGAAVFFIGLAILLISMVRGQLRWAPGPTTWSVFGLALGASVGLYLFTLPIAAENESADLIPLSSGGQFEDTATIQAQGPEPAAASGIRVTLRPGAVGLEGLQIATNADLTQKIGELLKVQQMMYPGSPSPPIHLLITADVSAALVTSVMATVRQGGAERFQLVFVTRTPLDRPYFGRFLATQASALTLSDNAEATITAAPEDPSAEWVPRLLAARKTAASVALALKEE